MVQLFSTDDDEKRIYEVWKKLISQTNIDLQAYFNDVYKSKTLGEVLYDLQILPMWDIIERDLFVRVYWEIIQAQEKNGSVDSFIKLINTIYQGQCAISIEKDPMHIKIDVTTGFRFTNHWVDKTKENFIVTLPMKDAETNFIIIAPATEDENGVVRFSDSGNVQTRFTPQNLQENVNRLYIRIKTGTDITTRQTVFSNETNNYRLPEISIENGRFIYSASSNGLTWDLLNDYPGEQIVLAPETEYTLQLTFFDNDGGFAASSVIGGTTLQDFYNPGTISAATNFDASIKLGNNFDNNSPFLGDLYLFDFMWENVSTGLIEYIPPEGDEPIPVDSQFIIFKQIIKDVTDRELGDLMRSITNYGVVAEFWVNEREV